jgi:hypothetical protein
VSYFFSKEPVFLMPARTSPLALEAEIGVRKGTAALFSREPLFLVLPPEIGCPATPADRITGNHYTFFEGTTFPPSFRPKLAAAGSNDIG